MRLERTSLDVEAVMTQAVGQLQVQRRQCVGTFARRRPRQSLRAPATETRHLEIERGRNNGAGEAAQFRQPRCSDTAEEGQRQMKVRARR